jgi:hypothetical protein
MLNPDFHKNEGESLLSKIIFDCATKAKLSCRVNDVWYYDIKGPKFCDIVHVHRMGELWCSCELIDSKVHIHLASQPENDDSRISPKFWHILVRPDTIRQEIIVDLNDPKAFDDIIELFVALRPIR